MKTERIIEELESIVQSGGGCLCGHSEWCENCSPSSTKNIIRGKIRELISKLKKPVDSKKKGPHLDSYTLKKHKAWKEEYSLFITWDSFNEKFLWCDRCESWEEGQCICYAR